MKLTYIAFFSFCFIGCFAWFDSESDTIIGKYNVTWIDLPSSRSIDISNKTGQGGGAQIIPPYIFGVGHNKNFIIAKQHPVNGNKVNTLQTNYYIIDIRNENYNREEIYGPFSKAQFDSSLIKLHVGLIEFNMSYPDNP